MSPFQKYVAISLVHYCLSSFVRPISLTFQASVAALNWATNQRHQCSQHSVTLRSDLASLQPRRTGTALVDLTETTPPSVVPRASHPPEGQRCASVCDAAVGCAASSSGKAEGTAAALSCVAATAAVCAQCDRWDGSRDGMVGLVSLLSLPALGHRRVQMQSCCHFVSLFFDARRRELVSRPRPLGHSFVPSCVNLTRADRPGAQWIARRGGSL